MVDMSKEKSFDLWRMWVVAGDEKDANQQKLCHEI